MKTPGPDHPITITENAKRVVIRAAGQVIADTRQALTLAEAAYPPVQYIPRSDIDMSLLERSTHATTCPFKGQAAYFSIRVDGAAPIENAAWSYETPHPAVASIAGHLAFYPPIVDSIEELDD